ncbi:MAG TPA: flagellar basal body L-ring protein FlgH [Terriglobales bacterium]|nr:flagellar basal body L-ring protein FlgH [Terriglobales bacterium]
MIAARHNRSRNRRRCARLAGIAILLPASFCLGKTKFKDPQQTRAEYIQQLQEQVNLPPPTTTIGSLWSPGSALTDMSADYKAHRIGDIIMLQVLEQTTAQSAGSVDSERAFQTNSGITALPGKLKVSGVNPLFGAQSATQLKGQGTSSNTSKLLTAVSAQVIAVLPNGNLVVEAQREVFMNNQHETLFARGVLRPGDINPDNTAPSTALANLEIELKGKGVISDSIARPNPIMRAILWFVGF